MSVRVRPDKLYVYLDFEGLGSFERVEQEDVMLVRMMHDKGNHGSRLIPFVVVVVAP